MRCFVHNDAQAVGICKNCSKALCLKCCRETDGILVCSSECEESVRSERKARSLANQSLGKAGAAYRQYGHFYAICGVILLAVGLLPWFLAGERGAILAIPFGVACFMAAYWSYRSGKRFTTDEET